MICNWRDPMSLRHPVRATRMFWNLEYIEWQEPLSSHHSYECHEPLVQGLCACVWVPVVQSVTPTGWRRLVGSPKLQIIFHKRATKYRSLLRKMTYKDKDPVGLRHPVSVTRMKKHERLLLLVHVTPSIDGGYSPLTRRSSRKIIVLLCKRAL